MRCFLVHVDYGGNNVFIPYPLDKEVSRPLEECRRFLNAFPLEKFRAGGYQRINKPGTVLAGTAPGLFNAALDKVIVSSLWFDYVKIVLAFCRVYVGIAGVFLFLALMVGLHRPGRSALVLLKT